MWPRVAAVLALAAALGATALVVAGPARVVGGGCGQSFDRAAWTDDASRSDEADRLHRCDMADAWTTRRVRAELGPPSRRGGGTWRYDLPGGGRLEILLDEDHGKVVATDVVDGDPYLRSPLDQD